MATENLYRLFLIKFLILSFILFSSPLVAQTDYLPYKLEHSLTAQFDYGLFEGHVFDKNEAVLIGRQLRPLPNYPEFRISDEMNGFIDNIIADSEYPEISFYIYVADIDNDGLDEIVIPFIGNKNIKFLLYDYKNGKAEVTEIFKLELSETQKTQYNIFYSQININNSKENELLISVNSTYPKIGSIRGVFAIDIKKRKELWFYPTAEYCNGSALLTLNNKYIVLSSSSVSNGVAFSNNTFFKANKDGITYTPYKTAYTEINSTTLDTTADDYSTDETADIICIDKTGKKVWEKEFGKEFVWSEIVKNDNNIIYCPKHRNAKDTVKSRLFLINPTNGNILQEKIITNGKIKNIGFKNRRIFICLANDLSNVYDFDFNKLNDKPIRKSQITDYFRKNGKEFYLGIGFNEKSHYTMVYNNNFELVAKSISGVHNPYYFPLTEKIVKYDKKIKYSLYNLVYIPWYMRINPSQLWRYSFITSLLLIILVFAWGYSHYRASKIIKQQKVELEKTTSELIRKEKLSVLGTIASSVAHELNSPLGAILNSSQRILKYNRLEATDKENLELINDATISCKTIVEKFLASSKPNKKIIGCYIDDVMNNWFKLYQKKYTSNDINLVTNFEANCYLKINNIEMYQIINNILSNAQYQLLNSNNFDKTITITSKQKNDYCQIVFEDTGGGFSDDILNNKFKAFYTTKKNGEGTGLGLWTIKKIIEDIKGKIVLSNTNKGAKIVLEIPLMNNINVT